MNKDNSNITLGVLKYTIDKLKVLLSKKADFSHNHLVTDLVETDVKQFINSDEKNKISKLITNGDGSQVLSNNGTYTDIKTLATSSAINAISTNLIDKIYPLGSIYMSINNVSPATFIGGTWVALQDRFLIGAGASYSVNVTGGEVAHTLTPAEMPIHAHQSTTDIYAKAYSTTTADASPAAVISTARESVYFRNANLASNNTGNAGSGSAHNNMPPYLAVYMWKRTV